MGLRDVNKVVSTTATAPCAHLRSAYHDCFNRWYSDKFLRGQWDKLECVAEWDKYRACLAKHLEDKHLRRILPEETLPYTSGDSFSSTDVDGEVRQ